MTLRDEQHDDVTINALSFVKVTTDRRGYLTPLSCKMLLVELHRWGFDLAKRADGECLPTARLEKEG